jgi:hypothetical protein
LLRSVFFITILTDLDFLLVGVVDLGTVKSGNFVTFFAQNIFFHKIS